MSDFSNSWYGMKETPDFGVTAMGGSSKKSPKVDNSVAHYSLIMELEHKHAWLEHKGKKLSCWAHSINDQSKAAQVAPEYLKADMLKHVETKKKLLREAVERKLAHKKSFEDFVDLINKAFPGNKSIKKRLSDTIKLHEQFIADVKRAKELVH